jgi:hypothetical protein
VPTSVGNWQISQGRQGKNWFGYEVARVIGMDDVGPKTAGRADASHREREFIVPGSLKDAVAGPSPTGPVTDESTSDDE